MDRFIENTVEYQSMFVEYLKSNMDRFIVEVEINSFRENPNLKSNMDRFIGQENYSEQFRKRI